MLRFDRKQQNSESNYTAIKNNIKVSGPYKEQERSDTTCKRFSIRLTAILRNRGSQKELV